MRHDSESMCNSLEIIPAVMDEASPITVDRAKSTITATGRL